MNEPILHDWEYEKDSKRAAEISEAVKDRIDDLMLASGHGRDEQVLMEKVLSTLAESGTGYSTIKRYLFEIWKLRGAQTHTEKMKRTRATQVLANIMATVLRDIVTSEVIQSFEP